MTPVLSIIIPTYNSERFIDNAIKSIISQSFEDFEIIIIDGLSEDKTIEKIRKFAQFDSQISILSEKDSGIYDAMNKGISLANGEWVYFMGSDDTFINRDVLKNVSESISDYVDVVYGNVISTRFNGRYDGEFSIKKIYHQNICHQSIFFRKSVFKKIGTFNLKYAAHADWDNNMKWIINKEIKKKYLDLDVAHYADGGFSSTIEGGCDKVFETDREMNFLNYCLNAPKDPFIIKYSKALLKTNFHKKNAIKLFLSSYVFFKQKFLN